MKSVDADDVRTARERFDDESVVRETPIEQSRSLSEIAGTEVYLKMEHLQRTGSFKPRGAYNKLSALADSGGVTRVVAASAGNHAQGVALAATTVGMDATVVMPRTAPQSKVNATRDYGAEVVLHGSAFPETLSHAKSLTDDGRTAFIHAYDDPHIVAGQGTLGLEIHEQCPEADVVVVPIGGGGLIGGIAAALDEVSPETRVVGVQAEGAATVPRSLERGEPVSIENPHTIADGIATGGVSEFTLGLIREHVDGVVVVSDDEIANAILLLLERAKQLVEGAGAASVAGLLDAVDVDGGSAVAVLSGGNIDPALLQTVLTYSLADRAQILHLRARIDDQPGAMGAISGAIADQGANIRTVRHDRAVGDLHVGEAFLVFEVVTGGEEHARNVIGAIADRGYDVTRVN